MKVYLSTAITRGRREYVDAVRNIFDALKDEGVDVLNERGADPNFPDPHPARAQRVGHGVGGGPTQVQRRGKPVLLLYDAPLGFRISDWVTHNPEANVQARPYRDRNEIARIVKEFVGA